MAERSSLFPVIPLSYRNSGSFIRSNGIFSALYPQSEPSSQYDLYFEVFRNLCFMVVCSSSVVLLLRKKHDGFIGNLLLSIWQKICSL